MLNEADCQRRACLESRGQKGEPRNNVKGINENLKAQHPQNILCQGKETPLCSTDSEDVTALWQSTLPLKSGRMLSVDSILKHKDVNNAYFAGPISAQNSYNPLKQLTFRFLNRQRFSDQKSSLLRKDCSLEFSETAEVLQPREGANPTNAQRVQNCAE